MFGKLPFSLWPDPQSIRHLRPTETTFILPEFLTLFFIIILVVFGCSSAMQNQTRAEAQHLSTKSVNTCVRHLS